MVTHVALRPMGLTLIIPFRNSMNVPLESAVGSARRHRGRWAASRRDIPLNREIYVGEIVENEVSEGFVAVLADKLDEGLGRQLIA